MNSPRRFVAIPVLVVISISLLLAGCWESPADISNPQTYDKDGLTFTYPGNWKVVEDVAGDPVRYLFVESPGEALVIVQVDSSGQAKSLKPFAESFSQRAATETPIGSTGQNEFGPLETRAAYEAIQEKFSITLLSVEVSHTRVYLRKASGDTTLFIINQASDEDLASVEPGFDQISTSLEMQEPGK